MLRFKPALEHAIGVAVASAATAGHPKATVYHLLDALVADPGVEHLVRAAGGTLDVLHSALRSELATVSRPSAAERLSAVLLWRYQPPLDSLFKQAIRHAARHMQRASQPEVGAEDVLVASFRLRNEAVLAALRVGGLSRLTLVRLICHGDARSQPEAPVTAEYVEIVIHNDHYTQMETVVQVLAEAFRMNSLLAFRTMTRVHRSGRAVIGPFARHEALQMAQAAIAIVEAKEEPLRLTLQPAVATIAT